MEQTPLRKYRFFTGYFVIVLLLIVPYGIAEATGMATPTTPEAAVLKYLELDAQGAALTEEGRAKLQDLAVVPVGAPPETGPTITYVIKDYRTNASSVSGDKAVVTVEYRLIGTILNYVNFEQQIATREAEINLIKRDGGWYVNTIQWPYMSWQTVVTEIKAEWKRSLEYEKTITDEALREYFRNTRAADLERSNNTIRTITDVARRAFSSCQ